MDIKIELEVKAKAFEIYKKILNKNNTVIVFNDGTNENIVNRTTVKNRNHEFRVVKRNYPIEVNVINKKYSRFIPKKIKNIKNPNQQLTELEKLKYLKIFRPFLGEIKKTKETLVVRHILNYNGVVYQIKESEFEKLSFYAEYAYKIYQLRKLNKELGIDQNISLYFDEDVLSSSMYNKIHNIIKDVLQKL